MSIFKLILGQRAPPFSYILSSRSLLSTPTTAEPTLLASRLVLLILASLASCSLSRCSFVGRRRLRVACHEINGKRFTFRIYLIVRWRRKFSSANSTFVTKDFQHFPYILYTYIHSLDFHTSLSPCSRRNFCLLFNFFYPLPLIQPLGSLSSFSYHTFFLPHSISVVLIFLPAFLPFCRYICFFQIRSIVRNNSIKIEEEGSTSNKGL